MNLNILISFDRVYLQIIIKSFLKLFKIISFLEFKQQTCYIIQKQFKVIFSNTVFEQMLKKLPIKKQPPPQVFQEESSQDQAQPLIQQVDPTYEPTERQVRQYAIQTLGMKLPEDENLLYLAREGLKAPIAANWVPYQSPNGQIYYKHNITQQKTFDHPTDTEYRKKYEQIKEKAARKNLKSINLKQSMGMQGLLPNNSLNSLGLNNNSALGGNISNLSGLSMGEDAIQPTIDDQIIEEYEKDLKQFEKKQERQWKQYQQQCEQEHNKRMKELKSEAEEERSRLQGKTSNVKKSESKILQEQKNKIQKSLEQAEQSVLKQQVRNLQREQQNKLSEYKAVYEEDNNIKLMKVQQEMENNYEEKSRLLEEKLIKIEQKKQKDKEARIQTLKSAREELQSPENAQIAQMLAKTLEDNMRDIKQQYDRKLKQRQDELERQLAQMKRLLGMDQTQNLLSLASRKQRLLDISKQKLTAKREKELQIIETQTQKQLQSEIDSVKKKLQRQCELKLQSKKKELESKYQKSKAQIQSNYINKLEKQVEQMYQATSVDKNNYEGLMNKKLSELRMKYINKLQDIGKQKNKGKQQLIVNRVMLSEKEAQVQNKDELIRNLEKQLNMQRFQWKLTKLQQQISSTLAQSSNNSNSQLTNLLKQKLKALSIKFQPSELAKNIQNFHQLQTKYKQDKKLLGKVLRALQQTSAYNLYEMRKNPIDTDFHSVGSGAMVKKYNQDVRKMRENQEKLAHYEVLIKKAEFGGSDFEQNLAKLKEFAASFQYKQIGLKIELERHDYRGTNINPENNKKGQQSLDQISEIEVKPKQKRKQAPNPSWNIGFNYPASSYSNLYSNSNPNSGMEQTLKQHSRFLSNVKNELNKKLYQVRYDHRY